MLVLTHGRELSPFATALRASSPAPTMTEGFEVLVHDVMAAITMAPSRSSWLSPLISHATPGSGAATVAVTGD